MHCLLCHAHEVFNVCAGQSEESVRIQNRGQAWTSILQEFAGSAYQVVLRTHPNLYFVFTLIASASDVATTVWCGIHLD
jgi:hypothetical protein